MWERKTRATVEKIQLVHYGSPPKTFLTCTTYSPLTERLNATRGHYANVASALHNIGRSHNSVRHGEVLAERHPVPRGYLDMPLVTKAYHAGGKGGGATPRSVARDAGKGAEHCHRVNQCIAPIVQQRRSSLHRRF